MLDIDSPPTPTDSEQDRFTEEGKLLDLSRSELEARLKETDWIEELIHDNHRVSWTNLAHVNASMKLVTEEREAYEGQDRAFDVKEEGVDGFECQCGKDFEEKDAVREHLAVIGQLRTMDLNWAVGDVIEWMDETEFNPDGPAEVDLPELNVTIRPNHAGWLRNERFVQNAGGLVVDGEDDLERYIDRCANESIRPPADYAFDNWDELNEEAITADTPIGPDDKDGLVVFARHLKESNDDDVRIVTINRTLTEAVFRSMTGGGDYDPDDYRVHICFDQPVVIEGNGEYRLVSPRLANVSND